jgi:MoaA/NifB/PqqE/SkfB family radical SAM enzyme
MLTFNQVEAILSNLYRKGVRILIFEGGEPFLWRDGIYTIHDVVERARRLFYSVGMTTNGTFPLTINASTIWVSIDGLRETHNRIRDNSFDKAISNIEHSPHPNIYANVTINRINYREIPELVRFLAERVRGITIQFHYPYEESDSLTLPFEERRKVLNDLIALKKKGYPVTDSNRCLEALKDNSWHCQDWMLANVEPDGTINLGCYVKGRGDIQCAWCGFAAHTEISLAYGWHLPAILAGRKIFRYGKSSTLFPAS